MSSPDKAATLGLADGAQVADEALESAGYRLSAYTEDRELLPQ